MKPVIKKAAPSEKAAAEQKPAPEAPKPATGTARPRPVVKPVIRKPEAPVSEDKQPSGEEPKKKPKPVIKPIMSKRPMQAEDKHDKGTDEEAIKQSKPVVDKKVVVRKPAHEDKTAEDKQQEDSQLPEPPGRPD